MDRLLKDFVNKIRLYKLSTMNAKTTSSVGRVLLNFTIDVM